eukprot:m.224205 g.224205  ORF g.224205 m.224205 type:complete len:78 (+) comp39990_c0_seq23:1923-2156(+)
MDYKEMAQEIEEHTGGLSSSPHLVSGLDNLNGYEQGITFSSHCLNRNTPYMFSIWEDLFNLCVVFFIVCVVTPCWQA